MMEKTALIPVQRQFFNYRLALGAISSIMLIFLPLLAPTYGINLAVQALILGIFAASLNLLLGYTGLASLGHAAFFGVGAYTAGILATHGVTGLWIPMLAGIGMAALVAAIFGLLVARSEGAYFLMITLAFGQMLFGLAWQWRSLTGGDDGISGISRPDWFLPWTLWNTTTFYYLVLFFFLLIVVGIYFLIRSPFGRAMIGIRESESRMRALGYHTGRYKYVVYILGGALAGLAGVLSVFYTGYVGPNDLAWTLSGQAMLMVIIGGSGTLIGPSVGAAVVILLENLVSSYTERWPIVMGVIFIICVVYARQGLVGLITNWGEKRRKRYGAAG